MRPPLVLLRDPVSALFYTPEHTPGVPHLHLLSADPANAMVFDRQHALALVVADPEAHEIVEVVVPRMRCKRKRKPRRKNMARGRR